MRLFKHVLNPVSSDQWNYESDNSKFPVRCTKEVVWTHWPKWFLKEETTLAHQKRKKYLLMHSLRAIQTLEVNNSQLQSKFVLDHLTNEHTQTLSAFYTGFSSWGVICTPTKISWCGNSKIAKTSSIKMHQKIFFRACARKQLPTLLLFHRAKILFLCFYQHSRAKTDTLSWVKVVNLLWVFQIHISRKNTRSQQILNEIA